ncbi:RES family NAD+ phosphorylase [Pseudomonas sp. CDFA 602]|uniref:RES family NAD+ phosphorylase n=1 Tax=Pseudomonas californiensis TaxID=2829823 RepID=UPI001E6177C5|nr:RES family NAD+ phosphorylase [Pseudomonas californiensis]MCD5994120.1 RES family NAD+ phosphorylase [Pseudomonas californiensis]MCD5999781.1 RES family NAD+ phosphorylase [Pseudomonas californiensis]
MEVWRLARTAVATDLTGRCAALSGARWNHRTHPALYFGLTPELCALETLMHSSEAPRLALKLVCVRLPDDPTLYHETTEAQLPPGWDARPADIVSMDFGTRWLKNRQHLGLIVPSPVMLQARLIVLNPVHPAAGRIEILTVSDFPHGQRERFTRQRP